MHQSLLFPPLSTLTSILQPNCHFHFAVQPPSLSPDSFLSAWIHRQCAVCSPFLRGDWSRTVGKGQCRLRWMYCWGKGQSPQRRKESASDSFRSTDKASETVGNKREEETVGRTSWLQTGCYGEINCRAKNKNYEIFYYATMTNSHVFHIRHINIT